MAAAGDPGVAIVVARRDGSVWCRGFGTAPVRAPVTCDTPFAIASLSKSVTALGVMQLVAAGRIRLDAPVAAYLPSFRSGDSPPITVRDLLQQRSGFSTADGRALMARPRMTIDERIAALQHVRLAVPAGSSFLYSNANYDVLGALIERVGGAPYMTYVNERIFHPLGITPVLSGCEEDVHGYVRLFSVPVPAPNFPTLCSDAAAGGLIMNGSQYGRYLAAQLDEGRSWSRSVLDADHWRLLHLPPGDSPYAMGWFVSTWNDGSVEWRHDGWAPAFHSFVTVFPERDIAIARLANANEVPDGGREFAAQIGLERIARGAPPGDPPLIPPDLYLRLGLLAAIVAGALQVRRVPARRRDAVVGAAAGALIVTAIVAYVGPQWAWDPRVGFFFSPDLTVLLFALIALLGAAVLRFTTRAFAPAARADGSSGTDVLP